MKTSLNSLKSLLFFLVLSGVSLANEPLTPPKVKWPFDGALGVTDRQAAQRGFQVYKEVCSACHSMKLVAYRNLESLGFSKEEVKSIASQYNVDAEPNENGEIKQRPALPSDHFVSPYPNENAARASNGGALPVDFSLIVKARHNGPNYIHALLTGYQDPPSGFTITEGKHYNPYFPGGQISMPPPLHDNAVTYTDGTESNLDQMARDVVNFLQWAAEPEMEKRKYMGIKIILYLSVMTVFFILAKKKIWSRLSLVSKEDK